MSVKSLSRTSRSYSALAGQVPEHHVFIAESTVGAGGVANITFSNIPQDYQHLQIRGIAQTNRASFVVDNITFQINNDTGTNYASHELYGGYVTTPTAGSSGGSNGTSGDFGRAVSTSAIGSPIFYGIVLDILDYSSSSKYKTIRSLGGFDMNGTGGSGSYGGTVAIKSNLWMSTSAVTSIKFFPQTGTALNQYTSFQLYGVK